jgi:YggT family protein
MLYQIVSFLMDLAVGFVSGACLLRLYMHVQRIPMSARSGNPIGPFVFALSDWLVLPLRRLIGVQGHWDLASLLAAYCLQLAGFLLLWLLAGAGAGIAAVPLLALFGLLRLVITMLTVGVLIHAVLSWVPTHSAVTHLLDLLVSPWLQPVRRRLPTLGGVDLSPLVVLVLLQIAAIVLAHLQAGLLGYA